jgi:hypothetical protein
VVSKISSLGCDVWASREMACAAVVYEFISFLYCDVWPSRGVTWNDTRG